MRKLRLETLPGAVIPALASQILRRIYEDNRGLIIRMTSAIPGQIARGGLKAVQWELIDGRVYSLRFLQHKPSRGNVCVQGGFLQEPLSRVRPWPAFVSKPEPWEYHFDSTEWIRDSGALICDLASKVEGDFKEFCRDLGQSFLRVADDYQQSYISGYHHTQTSSRRLEARKQRERWQHFDRKARPQGHVQQSVDPAFTGSTFGPWKRAIFPGRSRVKIAGPFWFAGVMRRRVR